MAITINGNPNGGQDISSAQLWDNSLAQELKNSPTNTLKKLAKNSGQIPNIKLPKIPGFENPSNWSKFNNFAGGTVGQAINVGTSLIANAVGNRTYEGKEGHITQGMDAAYDTVQSAISNIPGWGQAAGMIMGANKMLNNVMSKIGGGTDGVTKTDAILGSAFLAPIGWINGFGGKTANTYTRNQELDTNTNGGFQGFLTTQNQTEIGAGKKYGLFSRGTMNKQNKLTEFTQNMKHTVSGIVDANTINTLAAQGSTPFVANQQSVDIGGGVQQMRAARQGMKFEDLASVRRALSLYRVGGLIGKYRDGKTIKKDDEDLRLAKLKGEEPISYMNDGTPLYMKGDGTIGPISEPGKDNLFQLIEDSNANFAKRLKDPNRKAIKLPDGTWGNFKLAWSEDETGVIVYPEIQEIDGELVDLSNDRDAAWESAIKRGDYVYFPSKEAAEWFTTHYKEYYKGFDEEPESFKQGGKVNVIPEGALHARLHHLGEIDETLNEKNITTKGIPVITQEEGGEIIQHAEIEREEIIFNIDVTNKLEKLRKEDTDESAIEAGKLLVDEIMNNTIDNTGNLI